MYIHVKKYMCVYVDFHSTRMNVYALTEQYTLPFVTLVKCIPSLYLLFRAVTSM
jgi:hypothetical protein